MILAGWSDNYENYDVIQSNPTIKHMAATQNEVLQALAPACVLRTMPPMTMSAAQPTAWTSGVCTSTPTVRAS